MTVLLPKAFTGYRRPRRRPGVRNLPIVFPLSSRLSRLVELATTGSDAIGVQVHDALDGQLSSFERSLLGNFLANPNVGSVVIAALGDEEDAAPLIADHLAQCLVPVEVISLRGASSIDAFLADLRAAAGRAVVSCAAGERATFPASELVVGTECGGSDGYSGLTANPVVGRAMDRVISEGGTSLLCELPEAIGAEHLLAARATDSFVADQVVSAVRRWEELALAYGEDIRGAQPSPGNQDGGLTTIEEKSLGAIAKGGVSPIVEVAAFGQAPTRHGLVVMDTPGHDIEQMTGMAAAGAQLVLFTTGRGTPTGSPVAPTLKIATNQAVATELASLIDFDASTVLRGESFEDVATRLLALMDATIAGAPALSERAGQRDFALPPLGAVRASKEAAS